MGGGYYTPLSVDKTKAMIVRDGQVSTSKNTITAESVSFSAGVAGTNGVVSLANAPICNSDGAFVGQVSDTSFSWVTGTVLTTEVEYNKAQTDAQQYADMSNGEFAIDYLSGRIRYQKATTGTSDTCNYTSRNTNSTASLAANTPQVTTATGSAAINKTTAISGDFKLNNVSVHFSSAPTTSENFTISLDSADGTAYDTVISAKDPSASSATDMVYIPEEELRFKNGDQILVSFTNSDSRTYGLRITTEAI